MTRTHRLRRAALCAFLGPAVCTAAGCTRESLRSEAAAPPAAESKEAAELAASLAAAAATRPPAEQTRERSVAENLALGHREAEAGRPEQAARYYERVLREDPKNPGAHHRLAVIADQNRDFPTAERHYTAALAVRPGDPDLLNDLGYSYLMQGRHPEAEKLLRDAVAVAPRHDRALTNLGLLYGTIGDYDRALAVLRMTGSEAEARSKLAVLLPNRPAVAAGQNALAPQPAPEILTASATSPPMLPAGTPDDPNAATRDLMAQLARAGGTPGNLGNPAPAPAAAQGRLPEMIDPTTASAPPASLGAATPTPPQPYTRSFPHIAARPTDDSYPGAAGDGSPEQADPRVVTADARASGLDSRDELPLWSPPPGSPPPRPTPAQSPPQYAGMPSAAAPPSGPMPGGYRPNLPSGIQQAAAVRDLPPAAGQLPPPAYASRGGMTEPGTAFGPAASYNGYSAATQPPAQYAVPAGHTAPSYDTSAELGLYAADVARLQAEAAETRALLDAERPSPQGTYGQPQFPLTDGRTNPYYR